MFRMPLRKLDQLEPKRAELDRFEVAVAFGEFDKFDHRRGARG